MKKTWFLDPEIIEFWGPDGPRGPRNHSKKAGCLAPRLLGWFLGPPGPSRRPKSMISGSRKNDSPSSGAGAHSRKIWLDFDTPPYMKLWLLTAGPEEPG